MRYRVKGVKTKGREVVETEPTRCYGSAEVAAADMRRSKEYKTITILRDSEGEDHPRNAGKWVLERIVK